MIDYIRIVLLTGLIIFFLGTTIWRRRVSKKAGQWPSVEETIESGKLEQVAGGGRSPKVILPVFAFSYQVGVNIILAVLLCCRTSRIRSSRTVHLSST
jgi:hypothetical protein